MNRILAAVAGLTLLWGALPGRGAELHVLVKDHHGKLIADAVVLATPVDPKSAQRSKPPPDAIDQVDKQFVPYVKAVFVGSKVRFPNSDRIRHQVRRADEVERQGGNGDRRQRGGRERLPRRRYGMRGVQGLECGG